MKHLFLVLLVTASTAWANCPSATLIKKSGARTHYSTDLKQQFKQADLEKFGCKLNYSIMSKEQLAKLIEVEYQEAKRRL